MAIDDKPYRFEVLRAHSEFRNRMNEIHDESQEQAIGYPPMGAMANIACLRNALKSSGKRLFLGIMIKGLRI